MESKNRTMRKYLKIGVEEEDPRRRKKGMGNIRVGKGHGLLLLTDILRLMDLIMVRRHHRKVIHKNHRLIMGLPPLITSLRFRSLIVDLHLHPPTLLRLTMENRRTLMDRDQMTTNILILIISTSHIIDHDQIMDPLPLTSATVNTP